MTMPVDHTHDLDFGVSRSNSEIAFSQEWDGRLTWNEKDVSHSFITMILTSVIMVGWAFVPDSDRVTSYVGVTSTYRVQYGGGGLAHGHADKKQTNKQTNKQNYLK